jgi:hypothetical protein
MFLIAKGFDNWISVLVVLEGVTVDGKGYSIQRIWRTRLFVYYYKFFNC